MLTAARLIADVCQICKAPHYTAQALDLLNAVLGDLCETHPLALARGTFTFNFDPGLVSLFGSGPYSLPLDFLRTSDSSGTDGLTMPARYLYPAPAFPNGQPMPLIPIDLGEFDLYPQINAQGLPAVMATDMGGPLTDRIVFAGPASLTAASTTISLILATNVTNGLSIAGEGITPGTTVVSGAGVTLTATGTLTLGSPIITAMSSTANLIPGMAITGARIEPGAVIDSVDSASQITMTLNPSASAVVTLTFSGAALVLSNPATATIAAASVFFGIPPVCYIYPPPVGPYPVQVRYQRKMPPIIDTSKVPWFPNEGFLFKELSARLMMVTDDQREPAFAAAAQRNLGNYLGLTDDKTNRAQTVQMDPRRYGKGAGDRLRITKVAGW